MRFVLVALVAVLLADVASAQRWRGSDRIARPGDLALTFTAEDVWGGFDNGGVGLRAWLSDRLVGAASVGVTFERRDSEFGPDTERAAASLALGLEAHVGGSRTVSPFVGGGLRLGYARLEGADLFVVCPVAGPCVSYGGPEADELSIGAGLDLGAEVRLARGVTLLGAHRLGATFVSGDVDPGWGEPELQNPWGTLRSGAQATQDYTRWRIGTGETRVALSVYF